MNRSTRRARAIAIADTRNASARLALGLFATAVGAIAVILALPAAF